MIDIKPQMTKPIKLYAHDMKVVGELRFNNVILPIYNDKNEPLFCTKDILQMIDFGGSVKDFNTWIMSEQYGYIENDEFFIVPYDDQNEKDMISIYVTEFGLYNLLAHDRSQAATLWRRVIFEQLKKYREENGLDISEMFEQWDEMANDYYIDEFTGKLMKSVTVAGGDVIQVEA